MAENVGNSVASSAVSKDQDIKPKQPQLHLERKRTKEEEFKVLSDLSLLQNLSAMMEAEKFRKRKKRRRRKKKNVQAGAQEDVAVDTDNDEEQVDSVKAAEANKLLVPENVEPQSPLVNAVKEDKQADSVEEWETNKVLVSENAELQKPLVDAACEDKSNKVIAIEATNSFETKPIQISEKYVLEKELSFKNDAEGRSQEAKRGCKENEEVMSSVDEFKMLSDLSNFKNLAAMMEAEASMRRKKPRRKRKRKDTKFKIDKENRLQETRGKCKNNEEMMSYLDEFKMLSDLSNFRNLAAMMEAEAVMREKKTKRRKKKTKIKFEAEDEKTVDEGQCQQQPYTVEAVDMTKAPATGSASITQDVMPQKLFVDEVKGGQQLATVKAVDMRTTTEPVLIAKDIVEENLSAHYCFSYERIQSTKNCLEKNQESCSSSDLCLRCGDSGHDMFSCRNDYASDDLKEIQCYACKEFGHLCCVDFPDMHKSGQVSCYKCGQSGHSGSECTKWCGDHSKSR